jgi:hypothetical protein
MAAYGKSSVSITVYSCREMSVVPRIQRPGGGARHVRDIPSGTALPIEPSWTRSSASPKKTRGGDRLVARITKARRWPDDKTPGGNG